MEGGGVELGDVPQLAQKQEVLHRQRHRGDEGLEVAGKHHDGGGHGGEDGPGQDGAGEEGEQAGEEGHEPHRPPKPSGGEAGGEDGQALVDDHLVHQSHHQGVEHHGHRQHHRGSPTAAEQGLAQTLGSMQHNQSPYGEPMGFQTICSTLSRCPGAVNAQDLGIPRVRFVLFCHHYHGIIAAAAAIIL